MEKKKGYFKIFDTGEGLQMDWGGRILSYSSAKIFAKQILRMLEEHEQKFSSK